MGLLGTVSSLSGKSLLDKPLLTLTVWQSDGHREKTYGLWLTSLCAGWGLRIDIGMARQLLESRKTRLYIAPETHFLLLEDWQCWRIQSNIGNSVWFKKWWYAHGLHRRSRNSTNWCLVTWLLALEHVWDCPMGVHGVCFWVTRDIDTVSWTHGPCWFSGLVKGWYTVES